MKTIEAKDIELSPVGEDKVSIYENQLEREVQIYQKERMLYVFDKEGNNFEVFNHYDQVEKVKEEIVDKEYIKSQMPGIVARVTVKKGDKVKKGDPVAYLQAMKMEHKILAPEDTEIVEVLVEEKAFVEAGQPLFKLKASN